MTPREKPSLTDHDLLILLNERVTLIYGGLKWLGVAVGGAIVAAIINLVLKT